MKSSELRAKLEELEKEYGNLDVDVDLKDHLGTSLIKDKLPKPEFFHEVKVKSKEGANLDNYRKEQELENIIYQLPPEIQRLYVAMFEATPDGFEFGIDISTEDGGRQHIKPIFMPKNQGEEE